MTNEMSGEVLAKRANAASTRYLVHRGYEVIDTDYECEAGIIPIIAKDGDALAFIEVSAHYQSGEGLPEEEQVKTELKKYEQIAVSYLMEHPEMGADYQIRFDILSMVVIGTDRALIRHHISAMTIG